jgi:hypothetical protein
LRKATLKSSHRLKGVGYFAVAGRVGFGGSLVRVGRLVARGSLQVALALRREALGQTSEFSPLSRGRALKPENSRRLQTRFQHRCIRLAGATC